MPDWYLGGGLLVNAIPDFDLAVTHYRRFGTEPMAAANAFAAVSLDGSRGAKYGADVGRFHNFLELIQNLTAMAARGWVVLVNHGMSDDQGRPLGLVLELTQQHSPWRVDEYVLGLLADFMTKEPAEADFTRLERNSRITAANTPLPPGTLKPLHEALKVLRGKKLQRLEIRACNLGGNPTVMRLLQRVFGITEAISAPRVHMFYGTVPAHARPVSAAGFQGFQQTHRTARVFTDATQQKPGSVALQVNGHGAHRTFDFAADTVDVSWFVDQNIMWGAYPAPPQTAQMIPPFTFAGMDIDATFALALESGYRANLVEFKNP